MEIDKAGDLIDELLNIHGLDKSWQWKFDGRMLLEYGQCNHTTKTLRFMRQFIEANSEAIVRELMLHEVAHAMDTRMTGHSALWATIARMVGATGVVMIEDVDVRTLGPVVVPDRTKAHWVRVATRTALMAAAKAGTRTWPTRGAKAGAKL